LPPAAAPIRLGELASGFRALFLGRKALERFRCELREYFGVKHCFLVSSGKAAFTLILQALGELFPGRDEVVIPAFTCYSVPSSVLRAGLRIRLCDLQQDSLDLDFAQLAALLSEPLGQGRGDISARVLAVVPTHLYGYPSDVQRARRLVPDDRISIVEDAAQAMGGSWNGRKLGSLGDVSFLSLGRGKALSTVEGGIILTDRDDIAEVLSRRVGSLPGYGFCGVLKLTSKAVGLALFTHPLLFWIPRSMPFLALGETLFERDFPILNMSSFQAGLAAGWGARLESMRDARSAHSRRWFAILEDIGERLAWPRSSSLGLLRFPLRVRDADRRRRLLLESAERGAGIAPVYPGSLNRLAELADQVLAQACPVAEGCAKELVTLPTHEYVTQEDLTKIRTLVSRALG
jgi:perosamine synthetase